MPELQTVRAQGQEQSRQCPDCREQHLIRHSLVVSSQLFVLMTVGRVVMTSAE